MSHVKPEQETIMPPYPLGSPPPSNPAEVETAEQAGAMPAKPDDPRRDLDAECDDCGGPAGEQRPPADS
jgi:hypothetical protein